ncbi:hypothetical protein H5410_046068 [Solanum commersonii]|uniref:Uncharacterized protein n=1 Tax=Solanum commersonii TaxID=4109 RepID=A0A9J5XD37_SOLCO|nr:hypothetical protein H5410_046068 [Solanum commersonii]
MVHLERVNPSPSPIHSARESEWAKVEVVLNAATRCSRETEFIRVACGEEANLGQLGEATASPPQVVP